MNHTITSSISLETETCCRCGVVFAMPDFLMRKRRQDGGDFFCPNGHNMVYGKGEIGRLRDELDATKKSLTASKCDAATERRKREQIENDFLCHKNRVKNGVCPCCNRSFQNLRRHIKTKHPEFQSK